MIRLLQMNEKDLKDALEEQGKQEDCYQIPALDEVVTDIVVGDLLQLGDHVLICGDSTHPETYEKLLGGFKMDSLITDPPYNVDYSSKTEYMLKIGRGYIREPIENDQIDDMRAFLYDFLTAVKPNLADYNSIYITFAEVTLDKLIYAFKLAGYKHAQTLIWNKNRIVFGRSDYPYKHEPILYGWLNHHKFYGSHTSTVWDIPKPHQSKLHPTMKPVELMVRAIVNSTMPGMAVLDPFGGSGSTLIACEQTGRRCYMAEIDPRYCQIIADRWVHYTGGVVIRQTQEAPQ